MARTEMDTVSIKQAVIDKLCAELDASETRNRGLHESIRSLIAQRDMWYRRWKFTSGAFLGFVALWLAWLIVTTIHRWS